MGTPPAGGIPRGGGIPRVPVRQSGSQGSLTRVAAELLVAGDFFLGHRRLDVADTWFFWLCASRSLVAAGVFDLASCCSCTSAPSV
jgi:hypothetical protein